ncbi:helix-turn-helix DNA binding domain protein [Mycobacterium phage IkeLoa]|uniref:Helix-turn-helix DNA binding domain protein n=3 Tax=Bixzunavirus TaxID=680114 RepID=A0A2D1G767_9CAUD|nr:hypothetical protein DANDELION_69 [Mycobacterium phage Dandelion]YP_009016528.1 hypothetical protein NAPPY_66 [Mycobacterium phage Nappy]YP_010057018.1 hypothetical protein KHO58_gp070 [Mycobacterium phage Bigswole]AVJ48577.1 hypothetical protein SEA_PIER_66 [Mycobacterium phage Pier]UVD40380.1 helix-turn-helix DNA binding domain protein [Mycobacterium phage IkeLoa]AEL97739.1 hypothetical protein DANDELION_69 [Mycobacterium phage Dandelion]AER25896.1 hypothetical protein NAPPY_66 [Mycobact
MSGLTPTQELVLEVLAARHRLGEQFWTFPNRRAIRKASRELAEAGLVWCDTAPTPGSFRVGLTEQGKLACIDPGYVPPVERTDREAIRKRMHEMIDNVLDGV